MKKNKLIIIIIGVLLVVLLVLLIILSNKKDTINNIVEDDNGEIEYNIPVSYDYDIDNNVNHIYINDKLINYENTPKSYDTFTNVSKNNIVYNAVYDDYVAMDVVTTKGDYIMRITDYIKSNYKYKGLYIFSNNIVSLYYIDDSICTSNTNIGEVYYVETNNDEVFIRSTSDTLTKDMFLEEFAYYCK